ncbi:guanylate cyclase [Legionella sainthelensi]|uniref:adenylate/guanylate cyclase domain-containing protein n=1 Tax=Legionella sainthelensi TaxID=28087 RepID=UPI000F6FAB98|nr:adenylate/guanylate cyclase domain-containing protein [Legionella sainthelensi]VEB35955.1 guanylate cyclase [Legionella sainthelensi]
MIHHIKVSIYLCIITLFVVLLSLVGATIISINYIGLNKILSSSAHSSIEQTSEIIKSHISEYLLPLNHDLVQIQYMLTNGIIDDRDEFESFIFNTVRKNPGISAAYYATITGDVYGVDRQESGIIAVDIITNSIKPPYKTRYEYNDQGHFLKKTTLDINYDPRTRPWYQDAVTAKKLVWTNIYQFHSFTKNTDVTYGITATIPIYGEHHKLEGVLGMDIAVNSMQKFINKLQVTPNSIIYITNEKNQIIAYRNPKQLLDIRGKRLTPKDLRFKIPIPISKLDSDSQQIPVTFYEYNNRQFFLVNQPIFNANSEKIWHITIIVPASDVLAPLRTLSLRILFLTVFILILGVLIARLVSQKISRPIIKLSKEAQEITQLNLEPKPLLKTMIKEISYMDKSLSNMRSSLASFQRYVPSSLVKKLLRSGKIAKVGGEYQNITILFSDIKDFTKLAEATPPKQLMNYLSGYFQLMTDTVLIHQGILDKYIGDAIMALWNTPLPDEFHILHACQTAVSMIEQVNQFNIKNQNQDLPELILRIGIHSGKAIVGNVGSAERLSFTALGDSVNLTSRLEAINKAYNTQIIVSKSIFEEAKNHFSFRMLDKVAVRGKRESTTIYELITAQNIQHLKKHVEEFEHAFYHYQKGNWNESLKLFAKLTPAYPGDQLAALYIERCHILIKKSPADWDGIWRHEAEF